MFGRKETDESEVQLDKSSRFQFIKIENNGRRFFCLQQSLAIFAWILFFKKDIFRPIERSASKPLTFRVVINWIQKQLSLVKTNLWHLVNFARYKYQWRENGSVVTVPVFGHVCIPVHKGYKIFDLRKETVAKVFDHDVKASCISSEIEGLKKISQFDFAPSIKRWNVAERWYEEDYVNGSLDDPRQPLESTKLFKHFFCNLVHPINRLILFQKPLIKNAVEYVNEILEKLKASRLPGQELPEKEFNAVKTFLDSIVERLRVKGNFPVYLVFTHGDFCPANMLNTRNGIKIIDWEGAGCRSALFDFYSYFFYRPVCRNVSVEILASEINEALPTFISRLSEKDSAISSSLMQLGNVYRWIYYFEQVCQEVEREMTDSNLNILDFIIRYIETFNRFEEILAGNSEIGS